jgi:hypothetical protein
MCSAGVGGAVAVVVVICLGLSGLFLFRSFMVPDRTARRRAQGAVVTCDMSCQAADRRALETTGRLDGTGRPTEGDQAGRGYNE